MSASWWYSQDKHKNGPVDEAELVSLAREGKIGRSALVWTSGMADWQPAAAASLLAPVFSEVPPPLPAETAGPSGPARENPVSKAVQVRVAGHWDRFFARMCDTWLEAMAVGVLAGALLPKEMFVGGRGLLLGLAGLPVALALDALIASFFGNTPGKALLGINVRQAQTGESLTLSQHLRRNLGLWVYGLAFGIPIVNLFTMAACAERLKQGGRTHWDESGDFQVYRSPSPWGTLAFVLLFVSVLFLMGILQDVARGQTSAQIQGAAVPKAPESLPAPIAGPRPVPGPDSAPWRNPRTGRTVPLPAGWTLLPGDEAGAPWGTYVFGSGDRCVFRAKLDSDSAANWTPVPRQTGQAFQGKLDTLKEL
jgi:hypothetical protein